MSLQLIAYWIVQTYFYVLMTRFVLDLIRSLNPSWRPRGPIMVASGIVFAITDPPIKFLRRFIKPVRVGAIAFDLAWTVLIIAVLLLRNLTHLLP
jgi:YggT family protein